MYIPFKPLFSRHKGIGIQFTDEPTGNLDSREAQEVIGLLKMTCREFNQTVVLVTHEKEIADMADQVIFLKDGKIAAMERRQKNYVG